MARKRASGKPAPPPACGPGRGVRVDERIVVGRPAQELFRLWRDLSTMSRVFHHVESVTCSGTRSHWVVPGSLGRTFEWDAEIVNEIPDRLIAWRSLPGADVDTAGSIHFEPIGDGGATAVRIVLRYDPPGGRVGGAVASGLGFDPGATIAEDLERFKRHVEAGRVPAKDAVQISSEDSFPASDPPSWSAR